MSIEKKNASMGIIVIIVMFIIGIVVGLLSGKLIFSSPKYVEYKPKPISERIEIINQSYVDGIGYKLILDRFAGDTLLVINNKTIIKLGI